MSEEEASAEVSPEKVADRSPPAVAGRALTTEELALLRRTFYVLRADDEEIRLVLTPLRYSHNVAWEVTKDVVTGAGAYLDLYAVLAALWASEESSAPGLLALLLTLVLTIVGSVLRHRDGYMSFRRGAGQVVMHLREKITGILPFPAFIFLEEQELCTGNRGPLLRRPDRRALKACYDLLVAFSGGGSDDLNRMWADRGRALARNFGVVSADREGVTFTASDRWWHQPGNGWEPWVSAPAWLPYVWFLYLADQHLWGFWSSPRRCVMSLVLVFAFRLWTVAWRPFFWGRFGFAWRLAIIKRSGMAELRSRRGRLQVRWPTGSGTLWKEEVPTDPDDEDAGQWSHMHCGPPYDAGPVLVGDLTDYDAAERDVLSIIDRTASPYRGPEPFETPKSTV